MRRIAVALACCGVTLSLGALGHAQFVAPTLRVTSFEITDPTIARNFEDPGDKLKGQIAAAIEERFLDAIRFLGRSEDELSDYQLRVTVEERKVPEISRAATDLGLSALRFELRRGDVRVAQAELPFLSGVEYLWAGDPERLANYIDERLWGLFSQGRNLERVFQEMLASIPIADEIQVVELAQPTEGPLSQDQILCILPFSLGSIGAQALTKFDIVVHDAMSFPHALRVEGYEPAEDDALVTVAPWEAPGGRAFGRVVEASAPRADVQDDGLSRPSLGELLRQLGRGTEPVDLGDRTVWARRAKTPVTVADYHFVVPPRAIPPSSVKGVAP